MIEIDEYVTKELEKICKEDKNYKDLLYLLYHNSQDLVLILDTLGRIVSINKAGLDFSNFKREEVIGHPFWKLPGVFSISQVKDYIKVFKDGLLGKPSYTFIRSLIDNNNKEHTMDFSVIPIRIKEKVRYILVIGKDITEKKEIKDAYQRTEIAKSNLQNIIDSSSQSILALTKDATIYLWNTSLKQLTGYSQQELQGTSIKDAAVFVKPDHLLTFIERVKQGKEETLENVILLSKTKAEKIVSFMGSPIFGKNGEYEGTVLTGKDISFDKDAVNRLIPGTSYVDLSSSNKTMMNLFLSITLSGYEGLIISRGEKDELDHMLNFSHISYYTLHPTFSEGTQQSRINDRLFTQITQFIDNHKKSIIFLDRIDVLLVQRSFEEFLLFIYAIQDAIAEKNALVLLRVNPGILTEEQQELLKEEIETLPTHAIQDISIDEVSIKMVRYISNQEKHRKLISYKSLVQHLQISKVTVSKKIKTLSDMNILSVQKQGRKKVVTLTGKGKELVSNIKNDKT